MRKIYLIIALFTGLCFANELADYRRGVLYASVQRGDVIEDIYAPREAIAALQREGVLPPQTLIVMEEFANENGRKGRINRYITMQKQDKVWKFKAFNADKSPNTREDGTRCANCHQNLQGEDIVFTLDRLKAFKLK